MFPGFDEGHIGFIKLKCPTGLFNLLSRHWTSTRHRLTLESDSCWGENKVIHNIYKTIPPVLTSADKEDYELGDLKSLTTTMLQPLMEEWCGTKLELPGIGHGPRTYLNGAVLHSHCDRIDSHALGAIISIDQDLASPWPLTITDLKGENHNISLVPGEMLLYESTRCMHGRLAPLNGRYVTNYFIHYKPLSGWNFSQDMANDSPYVDTPVYQIKQQPIQVTQDPNVR